MTAPQEHPASDVELIAAWRAGDEGAAAELVRRHARMVARFLGASGAGEDVEDLVQEAFFRAFRRIDQFRGAASFGTWVCAIASNRLKDLRRRRRRRLVLPLEDRDAPDPASDPHGRAVAREAHERLVAELGRLPRLQREVFLMRAQLGADYGEIADALETTPGAARVHYHHAVKRLKKIMEDHGG